MTTPTIDDIRKARTAAEQRIAACVAKEVWTLQEFSQLGVADVRIHLVDITKLSDMGSRFTPSGVKIEMESV